MNHFSRDNEEDSAVAWQDITELLQTAASSLTVHQPFLCDETSFQLHDAMAATQLGDSQMDCCAIPQSSFVVPAPDDDDPQTKNDDSRTKMVFPRPAPVGLDGVFTPLPWKQLTLSDSVWIALHTLLRLQSLLSGASVGESIFTCLYAHAPVLQDMEDRILAATTTTNTTPSHNHQSLHERMQIQLQLEEEQQQQQQGTTKTTKTTPTRSSSIPIIDWLPQWLVYVSSLALVEITVVIRGVIQNADIYEEEDFVAQTHQIPFFTTEPTTSSSSTRDLTECLTWGLKLLEQQQQQQDDDDDLSDNDRIVASMAGALMSFLLGFWTTLSKLV